MKIKVLILAAGLLWSPVFLNAQVAINNDGSDPHPGTILDISSTEGGVLFPRMTAAQISAIPNPPDYMMVINTDEGEICFYNPSVASNNWLPVDSRGVEFGNGPPSASVNTNLLYFNEENGRFYIHDSTSWNVIIPDDNDWTKTGDDMYSQQSGNVGIGASSPQEKLHVEGSIRMVDGNQATGYVMTSDADGTASWAAASSGSGGYTMQWGGSLRHNTYAKYGGTSDGSGSVPSDYSTKGVVLVSGSISKFSWSSVDADNTSVIDIIINGTSHNYVTLTGDVGVLTIPSIAVSEGDRIEIHGTNTGTTPYQTGLTLYIN